MAAARPRPGFLRFTAFIQGGAALFKFLKDIKEYGQDLLSHSLGVASYSVYIGGLGGACPQDLPTLAAGALLHDLGKTRLEPELLRKPGPLTSGEWVQVRMHPVAGALMLARELPAEPRQSQSHYSCLDLPGGGVLEVVLLHHEHWDGAGYYGYTGQSIPFYARVVALADALDAMTSVRSYRDPLSPGQVLSQLKKGAGRQFDPELSARVVRALEKGVGFAGDIRSPDGFVELLYRTVFSLGGGMGRTNLSREKRGELRELALAVENLKAHPASGEVG